MSGETAELRTPLDGQVCGALLDRQSAATIAHESTDSV